MSRACLLATLGVLLLVPGTAAAVGLSVSFNPSFQVPSELSVAELEDDFGFVANTPETLVLGSLTFDPGATTVPPTTWELGITDLFLDGIPVAAIGADTVVTHSVHYVRDASGNELSLSPAGDPIVVELSFLSGPLVLEGLPTAAVTGPVSDPPDGAPLVAPVRFQVTLVPEPATIALLLLSLASLSHRVAGHPRP